MSKNTNTTDLDTNINNYTVPEMLSILGLGNDSTDEDITNTTNTFITQANKSGNTDISNFFQDMQTTLLSYNDDGDGNGGENDINDDKP